MFGRSGFYSKCKSLIKLTRTRIDVVRRKRNATQKFLRKDIADLLANGLETNAYGRAEGLVKELILSSCYDFIDHVCEIILKHLPVLQKLRECPEDCREAVASLMFAAARFSDLPDLREVRDLFQERYGSSLEYFVNQKLVENITPKPPSTEKKVQLMQEIALEYSIPWDSRGFEERMSNPCAPKQNQNRSPPTIHPAESKVGRPFAEEIIHKTVNDEVLTKKRSEATHKNKGREVDGRHQTEPGKEVTLERRDELKRNVFRGPELIADRYKPPSFREETIQKREENDILPERREPKVIRHSERNRALEAVQIGISSHGKGLESVDSQHKVNRRREDNVPERDLFSTLSRHKPDQSPVVKNRTNFLSTVDNELAEDIQTRSTKLKLEDTKDGSKSNFRSAIPPPYVKPSKSKHKPDLGLTKHTHRDAFAEENDTLTFNPASNGNRSESALTKPDAPDHQNGVIVPENEDGPGRFTEIYYKDEFTPRRRSHKKKQSRSKSNNQDEKVKAEMGKEEGRVIRRVPTSRRKHESKKGLQILFDDDEHPKKKDEEEKMIDELLLLYSKKPSNEDPGKSRRKPKSEMSKSPHHITENGTRVDGDSTPTTSRTMSLPPQQVSEPEPKKVFTRAASFQPDTPAKHVHPKLPDYDDLAARFAALRASKG